ncbi:ZYRO0D03168p [Zygosaccharomyces rouxii]|uniref:Dynein heavy chain, cytoplasmic n=1 Tax=Zygosaccharomyces rouxii (strain ATCC 2623 / CBS 732 / NBRC 1130 / NCYC 568 / NRRL Y-229) TaxID=559307 RepID=C5DV18_ZYGRC|nr:uncharacterized protein ZYRO0D03168g [Zygosaccharomyces rouxii]KAH9200551.1 dynein heavy chain, N-terminal region 1-domain-containing protein [Zygosaccharomyces rouxii]CAR27637.1 ZYRO0D03168p [Zygosaccharomyces rouxii]
MAIDYLNVVNELVLYTSGVLQSIFGFSEARCGEIKVHLLDKFSNELELFLVGGEMKSYNTLFVTVLENQDVTLQVDIANLNQECAKFVILKNKEVIDYGNKPLQDQLSVLTLPSHIDTDSLVSIMNNGVYPTFSALIDSNALACTAESVRITRAKFKDLTTSFTTLKNSIPIPELIIHPEIKQIVENDTDIDSLLLEDLNFLNVLQSMANQWHRITRNLVSLQRNPDEGAAIDEIKFWSNFESCLSGTLAQLLDKPVQKSLEVLAITKRSRGSSAFIADTGIEEKLREVKGNNQYVSSIPLPELHSTTKLFELQESIKKIALSFKKFRSSDYPIDRFIIFLQKVSKDVGNKILELIPNVFEIPYEKFQQLTNEINDVIDTWDHVLSDNNMQIREVIRRKKIENVSFMSLDSSMNQLRDILSKIICFRLQHNKFKNTLENIGYEESAYDEEFVYEPLKVFQINSEFHDEWRKVKSAYNQRLSSLENRLIEICEEKLNHSQNLKEKLTVFLNFKPLMEYYPKLRSMMVNHQQILINLINEEVALIDEKLNWRANFEQVLQLRDLPPVASVATLSRITENHLQALSQQIEILIGPSWKDTPEGDSFLNKFDTILSKFNADNVSSEYLNNILRNKTAALDVPILKVLYNGEKYELFVNFDFSLGTIFKEIRNLIYMGYDIPNDISKIARKYRAFYPSAVLLLEQIQTFMSVMRELPKRPHTGIILKSQIDSIWTLLLEAMNTSWISMPKDITEGLKNDTFSSIIEKRLAKVLEDFAKLQRIEERLVYLFERLKKSQFEASTINGLITDFQVLINEMPLLGFDQDYVFTTSLNRSLKLMLLEKMKSFFRNLIFKNRTVLVRFEENSVIFTPDSEELKFLWLKEIDELVISFIDLPQLTTSNAPRRNGILKKALRKQFAAAYQQINHLHQQFLNYTTSWKESQRLWKLEESAVERFVGSDLNQCLQSLADLLHQRPSLSTFRPQNCFNGLLDFKYDEAFSKVLTKYNFWVSYLCNQLLSLYLKESTKFAEELRSQREHLEQNALDVSSLRNMSQLVREIDAVKERLRDREELLNSLKKSHNLFYVLHAELPPEFLFIEQLEADLRALCECSTKKEAILSKNRDIIVRKLEFEAQRVENLQAAVLNSWSKEKPVAVEWTPIDALSSIMVFEDSYNALKSDVQLISDSAKIMLVPIIIKDRLETFYEELVALKKVWMDLEVFWNDTHKLLRMPWEEIEVHTHIENFKLIQSSMKNVPFKTKQYTVFDNLLSTIDEVLGTEEILRILKDPSLKIRHWMYLFKKAGRGNLENSSTFSFESVLSIGLKSHETLIKELFQRAQKEYVLEKSLARMRSFWTSAQYRTFNHSSGLKLVGEWNSLIQACTEDLEELQSMKNSIHYKYFETECLDLEEKLTVLSNLLTEWMEVQFFWIDLFGVIGKNKEMQNLLSLESSKFQGLTADFKSLLTRIFSLNNAIDAVHVPEAMIILKRILESLKMIKSSLNDFLEQQRKLFPKFYFLGNDDLLKFIGAGEDLGKLVGFMPKMYGTIAGFDFKGTIIEGIYSSEGEHVQLIRKINVSSIRCDEWLSKLDNEMKLTIAESVSTCLSSLKNGVQFSELLDSYIFQTLLLSWQIFWTGAINESFNKANFPQVITSIERETAELIAELERRSKPIEKKKLRSLLIECLHFMDVTHRLNKTSLQKARLIWFNTQKFFYDHNRDPLERISISLADRVDLYGFAYIGIPERLVYTPTLQKGYIALSEALHQKYGGCFFGPAGTGKTETVKSLGQNLGRIVVVFNCDDSYDFQSMARLMMGISQVGAWGCFDEFNRLDENIMSAVSSQVEVVQNALATGKKEIDLMGTSATLNHTTALFITLNPDYAGRSRLPENLKKKFREFSIKKSDNDVIAGVILEILGFQKSKELSKKVVKLFNTLTERCSIQKHYDFGLRTLKKTLKNCFDLFNSSAENNEELILVRSLCQVILPTLVKSDEEKFLNCIQEVFSCGRVTERNENFIEIFSHTCKEQNISTTEEFIKKCLQIYNLQKNQQALIIAGEAGFGKTTTLKTVLKIVKVLENLENIVHTIDTKTLSKEEIYGSINRATLEWQDGIFTSIIRQVLNQNSQVENKIKFWVIFDSDMDPEYAETLNSALDDNKLITLPTGERLEIPTNLRIVFETHNLEQATPATITRCALVLFTERVCSSFGNLKCLLESSFDNLEAQSKVNPSLLNRYRTLLREIFSEKNVNHLISQAGKIEHILGYDHSRIFTTISKLISHDLQKYRSGLLNASDLAFEKFFYARIHQIIKVSFIGDTNLKDHSNFIDSIRDLSKCINNLNMDSESTEFVPETLEPIDLLSSVPQLSLDAKDVMKPNVIIPTIDTIKQELCVFELLNARRSVILCGPPGSGKTMILNNALQRSLNFQVVGLNFSKDTDISHILKTLNRHTYYTSGSRGLVLLPKNPTKDIVLFCDEINLPKLDAYGSQSTILFLRELIEKNGFWKTNENKWVTMERIHVVGACNPSTDPGRIFMTQRFTRHVTVLQISYPSIPSLKHIYRVFYDGILQLTPPFKRYSEGFAEGSIRLYEKCKYNFSGNSQTHYLISPRELTRWMRGFYISVANSFKPTLESLLLMWAYEAWRIFADKLIYQSEKDVFEKILHDTIHEFFPGKVSVDLNTSSLLFSYWLSLDYREVTKKELQDFVEQRFQTFCEEEVDTSFIIYDDMLAHLLRIDRVLRQVQGHAMLIGPCRTGKTTMTRFVAWLNGVEIVQPNIHRGFNIFDFDEFLRGVLLRCSIDDKRLCLLIDETDILEPSFLERMNTLLANSDVPDLFQNEDYETLMTSLKNRIFSLGLLMDTEQEMYQWFIQQISKNLHVIFIMRDPYNGNVPSMATSPALFNRCAINWMGDWSNDIMYQIADVIIRPLPLDTISRNKASSNNEMQLLLSGKSSHDVLIDLFLDFHGKCFQNKPNSSRSPGPFLDALKSFECSFERQYQELDDKQRFVRIGLDKLDESVLKVKDMNKLLLEKQEELKDKEGEARKTLDKMLYEQNEAERKQEAVVEIKKILATRQEESNIRRKRVMAELEAFAPIMNEAQRGVKNIKKQQLTEIRSMINPPSAVKITMEAVCAILGHRKSSWREIQNFIRKDEFIFDIVHFDTETMFPPEIKSFVEAEYFSNPNFTYEVVNRASKACGPLYQWVFAQLKYGEILSKAEPLKKEAQSVENEALKSKAKLLAAQDMINELQESIETSKENYSIIIRDIEMIKAKMRDVQNKLERSKTLISNLTSEKERWTRSTNSFKKASQELTGNCLISALYSNYCGGLVEKQRKQLFEDMKSTLFEHAIDFDPNYQFVTHNVEIERRFEWTALGLPNEEFFLENFSMVITSTNVPYILDPSSQMIPILSRFYTKRFTLTSFLETGFVKKLENAIRFGGVILIQDAEYFDPIISKLIAREYRASGGRQTVQVGEHEIDIASEFRLLLYSSDADAVIPNFVESRVRLINFSMNKGSVDMKAIRVALSKEVPEIDRERNELMKLNGEYKIMLKSLESKLLEELNDSQGNILENDELIHTLEKLKQESFEIEKKLEETEDFMKKANEYSHMYAPLGYHASTLYSILEYVSQLHWFYDISMWQFMECYESIFTTAKSNDGNRISSLVWNLYQEVYSTFSQYLMKKHRAAFAVVMYLTYCFAHNDRKFQEKSLSILKCIAISQQLQDVDVIKDDCPESLFEIVQMMQNKSTKTVLQEFQKHFQEQFSLDKFLSHKSGRFVLMASEMDVDASFKVSQLADVQRENLSVIALGSSESSNYAEQEITRCNHEGGWILLQNLQMSLTWTKSVLTKKLEQTTENVKVFMTCNLLGQDLPSPLLQQSYRSVHDGSPGILGTVRDLYFDNAVSDCQWKLPLCWFHSILLNRSLLAPIGFTKRYDFNDRDFACALQFLADLPVDHDARSKICSVLGSIVYGGKVDQDDDQLIVQSICNQIFQDSPITENRNQTLSSKIINGILPDSHDNDILSTFLMELQEPVDSYSVWLGLPNHAIREYESLQAQEVASQALSILVNHHH